MNHTHSQNNCLLSLALDEGGEGFEALPYLLSEAEVFVPDLLSAKFDEAAAGSLRSSTGCDGALDHDRPGDDVEGDAFAPRRPRFDKAGEMPVELWEVGNADEMPEGPWEFDDDALSAMSANAGEIPLDTLEDASLLLEFESATRNGSEHDVTLQSIVREHGWHKTVRLV